MKHLFLILFAAGIAGCTTPRQLIYDAEVDRLCAKDGGIVVYEQVVWPDEKFDSFGHPRVIPGGSRRGETYGPEYLTKLDYQQLRGGGGASISRMQTSITRRSDGKVLGTFTWYERAGGDWIGGFEHSTYTCPTRTKEIGHFVFVREPK